MYVRALATFENIPVPETIRANSTVLLEAMKQKEESLWRMGEMTVLSTHLSTFSIIPVNRQATVHITICKSLTVGC